MNPPPNIRDLLQGHVTLQLESLDRLYLNGYLPKLQYGAGLVQFLSRHRGHPIASPALQPKRLMMPARNSRHRGHPIASPALLGHITRQFVAQTTNLPKEEPSRCSLSHATSPRTVWRRSC